MKYKMMKRFDVNLNCKVSGDAGDFKFNSLLGSLVIENSKVNEFLDEMVNTDVNDLVRDMKLMGKDICIADDLKWKIKLNRRKRSITFTCDISDETIGSVVLTFVLTFDENETYTVLVEGE